MINPLEIRKEFSIYDENKDLVYLDSAATSLTPDSVVDKMSEYYKKYRSTVNRGDYPTSRIASSNYENARQTVADYFKVKSNEIIFTRSTTSSLNLIAKSLANKLDSNSEIIVTNMEHHSNFLPWLKLSEEIGCKLVIVEASNKEIKVEDVTSKINENTKIIAIHHVSNVIGDEVDVKAICQYINNNNLNIYKVIDGAQAASHIPVNIKDIGCDFYTVSAHKMYGPTGLGMCYIDEKVQSEINPFEYGGDMVDASSVDIDSFVAKTNFQKFEAGSQSIAEVIGFGESINFINKYGMENIHKHEIKLKEYALNKLKALGDKVTIYNADIENGIIIFNIKNVSVHDAVSASLLSDITFGEANIAIRHGQHCNNLTMKYVLEIPAVLRVSFAIYNSTEDVDKWIEQIKEIYLVWNEE